MEIRIFEKSPYVDGIDAVSRVSLWAFNKMNSDEIIKAGNVTRLPNGGMTFGDGRIATNPSFGCGPFLETLLADGTRLLLPSDGVYSMPMILAEANYKSETENSLYLCEKLGLTATE